MRQNLAYGPFRIKLTDTSSFWISHPFLAAVSVCGYKTQLLPNFRPKILLPQAIGTRASCGRKNPGSEQGHKEEVIEVPRLKGGILTIVGESQKLSFVVLNVVIRIIHPPKCARSQHCRCGATAFAGQTSELIYFPGLRGRLIFACRTEPELTGYKPGGNAFSTNLSGRRNRHSFKAVLCFVLAKPLHASP
jgi:hypothetical protein